MNFTNILEFQRARSFSEKMSATFEYIKQNFRSLAKSLLFIAGPPVILSSIFIGDIFNRFMDMSTASTQSGNLNEVQDYFSSSTFWLQLLGIIAFAWVGGVITIATTYGHMRVYNEKKSTSIEVSEVWACVRDTFWLHFWTLTLYGIAFFVITLILAIPLFFVIGLSVAISPVITIVGVLAFYALIGVVAMNLTLIFIIRENERIAFFDGLQRLFFLIRGKIWSTFGIGAINVLIHSTISTLFIIPWYIMFIIRSLHTMEGNVYEEPSGVMQMINAVFLVLYFISNTLLYALPLVAIAFQYYNLVEIREARGLMNNIDNFGQPVAPPPTDEHY